MISTRFFKRRTTAVGASPGAYHIPEGAHKPQIHAVSYSADFFDETTLETPAEAHALLRDDRVTWIDVRGLGDGQVLEQFAELFGLHRLAIADVANVGQRPKVEEYADVLFIVLRMVNLEESGEVAWEQVSLFLSESFVLTFQERPSDCLDPLRRRLREGKKTLRSSGADYLACMVVDSIVDGYFPVLEDFGELLEELENDVLINPQPGVLREVYGIKRALMTFRRAAWPLRDTLNQLLRDQHLLITETSSPYLRDATDHVMQVVDVIETYRELSGSLVDIYLSSISNRTNDVMRVLTVIATIFIPLTFVAGIYGMNFDTELPWNLPELGWRYGYVIFWVVCLLLGGGLLVMFRRLGWLGGDGGKKPPLADL